jgi:hypothetical protein
MDQEFVRNLDDNTVSYNAVDNAELLVAGAYDEGVVTEVIRPAAIVPEESARAILVELALHDAANGGLWHAEPALWSRYDRPWDRSTADTAELIGSLQVAYGTPTKYEITIYRVTVTRFGTEHGWTVESLTNAALVFGNLDLASCPRAALNDPPKPYRF